MGLVVQTTANLLPFQLAAEGDTSGEGAPSGVFAELLAALAGPGPAPAAAMGALAEGIALGRTPRWPRDLTPGVTKDGSLAADELAGAEAGALALAAGVPSALPPGQSPVAEAEAGPGLAPGAALPAAFAQLPAGESPGVQAAIPEPPVPGERTVAESASSSDHGIETGQDATPQMASRANPARIGSGEALVSFEAVPLAEAGEAVPASAEPQVAPAGERGAPPAGEPIADATPVPFAAGEPATEASVAEPTPQHSSEAGDGNEQLPGEGEPGQVAAPQGTPGQRPPGEEAPVLQGSVVRFAGNAIDKSRGDRPANRVNEPAHVQPDRPTPNASQQGIAHAAAHSAAGQLREVAVPADAPVIESPAPAAPVEVPPQVEQVGSAILERVEAGGGEATIHLEPAELGEVRIRVRLDDGRIHVEVHASRPESAQLFRDHTVDLMSLLGDRGLDLADVFVGTGDGSGEESRGEGAQQRRLTETGFAELLGVEQQPSGAERHNRLRAAYNPDGAHLFRI